MRRFVTALALALLLAWPLRWAAAHELDLFGHISVDPQGEITVRIVDPYGALIEGQKVTASATAPGGQTTRAVTLAEGPAGSYRGVVTAPGAERYTVTVDLELAGDLHRIRYEVTAGQGQPEQMLAMVAIDPPQGLNWSRILYIAAAVVLVAATAVALLKKRPVAEEE
ncbi:MAG: carboxypeptidase-like regulatory domain-containing protein [Bacillota bacterium]